MTYFINKQNLKIFTQSFVPPHPKAIIVFLHGYSEHSTRYLPLFETLNKENYAVYTFDHQCHGKSDGLRGYIENFGYLVDDAQYIVSKIQETNTLPLFLIGHSMGGNIAIQLATRDPTLFKSIYLSAPMIALHPSQATWWKVTLARLLAKIIPTVKFPTTKLHPKDVSRNPDLWTEDSLCYSHSMRINTGYNLIQACNDVKTLTLTIPFAIGIGSEDKVCSISDMKEFYEKYKHPQNNLFYYEGLYHQLLLEPESHQVISDLVHYFDAHL